MQSKAAPERESPEGVKNDVILRQANLLDRHTRTPFIFPLWPSYSLFSYIQHTKRDPAHVASSPAHFEALNLTRSIVRKIREKC